MEKLIDFNSFPVNACLDLLLLDRTTGGNVILATDAYSECGGHAGEKSPVSRDMLIGARALPIQSRVAKSQSQKVDRTRKKAEVFTPSWICGKMNNFCDEDWFDGRGTFCAGSVEDGKAGPCSWQFAEKDGWQKYVDSRRLEITCGEAPFLVSRYDASTGELIEVARRIGVLDRKLRAVNENAGTQEEWIKWALRAYESVYGYEFQGDSLVIARANLLVTFADFLQERWHRLPTVAELKAVAKIISWNIWQMDGLTGAIPFASIKPQDNQLELDLFADDFSAEADDPEPAPALCSIYDWRRRQRVVFNDIMEGKQMKFDYVIGNPPYQEESIGDNKGYAPPIYDKFINAAYGIAHKVELIHPARFLFNAGSTPKAWNEIMLNNNHFKVLEYESNSSKYFSSVSIMGGIVISYFDQYKNFGKIGVFSPFKELRSIREKITSYDGYQSIQEYIWIQTKFNLKALYIDHPEVKNGIGSDGKDNRFEKNIFKKVPLFTEIPTSEDDIRTLGISEAREREWRFIQKKYVDVSQENLMTYKVIVSVSNGAAGNLGDIPVRIIGESVLGYPRDGYTRSFIGIGCFSEKEEAINCQQYLKTKFARVLIGIMKTTQMLNPDVWRCVPLQDFTPNSDIDWSKSISDIDKQLYKKYNLSQDEIDFIESHVKEME